MTARTFLATNTHGLARAVCVNETWHVEHLLGDQSLLCLAPDPLDANVAYAGTRGS